MCCTKVTFSYTIFRRCAVLLPLSSYLHHTLLEHHLSSFCTTLTVVNRVRKQPLIRLLITRSSAAPTVCYGGGGLGRSKGTVSLRHQYRNQYTPSPQAHSHPHPLLSAHHIRWQMWLLSRCVTSTERSVVSPPDATCLTPCQRLLLTSQSRKIGTKDGRL